MKETFKTEKYTAAIFFLVLDKILNKTVNVRFPSVLENRMKNDLSLIFYEWKCGSLKANHENPLFCAVTTCRESNMHYTQVMSILLPKTVKGTILWP